MEKCFWFKSFDNKELYGQGYYFQWEIKIAKKKLEIPSSSCFSGDPMIDFGWNFLYSIFMHHSVLINIKILHLNTSQSWSRTFSIFNWKQAKINVCNFESANLALQSSLFFLNHTTRHMNSFCRSFDRKYLGENHHK